jgi:hypothetical protein
LVWGGVDEGGSGGAAGEAVAVAVTDDGVAAAPTGVATVIRFGLMDRTEVSSPVVLEPVVVTLLALVTPGTVAVDWNSRLCPVTPASPNAPNSKSC